jgi:hypothetical protein
MDRTRPARVMVTIVVTVVSIAVLSLAGCNSTSDGGSSQDGDSSPIPDGTMIPADRIDTAMRVTENVGDRETVSVILREEAGIGHVPPEAIGGRDLEERVVGETFTLEFDIDGDGASESLWVLEADFEPVIFFAWEANDLCHLTWEEAGTAWYIFDVCGGQSEEGPIVCGRTLSSQENSCSQCAEGACEACRTQGDAVYCGEEEPEADDRDVGPEPDGVDDISGDAPEDAADTTTDPDTDPVEPGQCSAECMAQAGAVCCTSCGCEGEVRCTPVCGDGFTWDCEIQCCFSYETYVCDCPEGSSWNGECCQDAQGNCL